MRSKVSWIHRHLRKSGHGFHSFFVVIPDETLDDQYLLKTEESNGTLKARRNIVEPKPRAQSAEELQQRLEIMQNKMKSKKSKPSERTIKKKQQKKLKKSAELKKQLISVAKSIKNEQIKERRGNTHNTNGASLLHANGSDGDVKPDIKADVKPAKTFNEEGKMVFSKFEFAARPSQAKKSKKDSKLMRTSTNSGTHVITRISIRTETIKNPKLLLQKIKSEKKEISELIEQGEVEKAGEIKKDIAWKKAFDKSDGKKVRHIDSIWLDRTTRWAFPFTQFSFITFFNR